MSDGERSAGSRGPIVVPDHVLLEKLPDDEAVCLNLATEEYFVLNPVATAMWTALTETRRVERAKARLEAQFEVDPETLARDVERFLQKLVDFGLVRFGADAGREGPESTSR